MRGGQSRIGVDLRAVGLPAPSSSSKINANRANSRKSTGPRTLSGRRTASLNAARHTILSKKVVLPGIERVDDWEAHRQATHEDLAPVGYLEANLADRVAFILWRLARVERYEAETTTTLLETAEEALRERIVQRRELESIDRGLVSGTLAALNFMHEAATPAQLREELEFITEEQAAFTALQKLADGDSMHPAHVERILFQVAEEVGLEAGALDELVPGFVTGDAAESEWQNWPGWTKSELLRVIALLAEIAADVRTAPPSVEKLLRCCEADATRRQVAAEYKLREVEKELQHMLRARTLLAPEMLERLSRYETHLERSLYRALHELQRLRALREGSGGAPLTLDIDVSAGRGCPGSA